MILLRQGSRRPGTRSPVREIIENLETRDNARKTPSAAHTAALPVPLAKADRIRAALFNRNHLPR
ncbi:hypothetical protein ASD03_27670 [Ensifer sp. Root127]|nr:hypothetical protein ASD03_27670 [Ensifer sp. Root127]